MKFITLLTAVATLGLWFMPAMAQPASPRGTAGYLDKTISIDFTNTKLQTVLEDVTRQTGVRFEPAQSVADMRLSAHLKNLPLSEIIRILSSYQYLIFSETGAGQFVVKPNGDVLGKLINTEMRGARLAEVLAEFSRQTGASFHADSGISDIELSIAFLDYPLGSVLKAIAKIKNLQFSRNGESDFTVSSKQNREVNTPLYLPTGK